jgi:hypothetical protein
MKFHQQLINHPKIIACACIEIFIVATFYLEFMDKVDIKTGFFIIFDLEIFLEQMIRK